MANIRTGGGPSALGGQLYASAPAAHYSTLSVYASQQQLPARCTPAPISEVGLGLILEGYGGGGVDGCQREEARGSMLTGQDDSQREKKRVG